MNSKISKNIQRWLRGRKVTPNEIPQSAPLAISQDSKHNEIAPIEDGLFEQTRIKWQCGDWDSLILSKIEDLQDDPQRGKLAALVAAAHQQKNNDIAAQEFLRLAKEWGCPPKYIARILISGTYDTLGKAAIVTGQMERALNLFECAVTRGTKTAETKILAAARGESHAQQLASLIKLKTVRSDSFSSLEANEALSKKKSSDVNSSSTENNTISVEIEKLRGDLRLTIKNEIAKSTKQLEAFINIQSYLANGEIIPELHGWPISPDIALYLIHTVSSEAYDIIVEFGSGTSTYLIAKTLQKILCSNNNQTKQVAFEHLEEFHKKTLKELSYRNLVDKVDVELSPLVGYSAPDGKDYLYYHCQEYLSILAAQTSKDNLKILVLVDGPPGSTGKHARYPALPIMVSHFPKAQIDFIIDDYERIDEREVVKKWVAQIEENYNFSVEEKRFEKGACLLRTKKIF